MKNISIRKHLHTTQRAIVTALILSSTLASCSSKRGDDTLDGTNNRSNICAVMNEESTPVGMYCFQCLHKDAQTQAMMIADVLRSSCKSKIAISYLIDDSFGYDEEFLQNHIALLAQDRLLTVVLYLSNGPAQRRWEHSALNGFASNLSPEEFREQIVSNADLQEQYRSLVQRAMNIVTSSPPSVEFIIIPQVEDNLTDDTYDYILDLSRSVTGNLVRYGRNPCPHCHRGNGRNIPEGVFLEGNLENPNSSVEYDILSNDGTPFYFSHEYYEGHETGLSNLLEIKNNAVNNKTMFLLWSAKYQGVIVDRDYHPNLPNPLILQPANEREYPLVSAQEFQELVKFFSGNYT